MGWLLLNSAFCIEYVYNDLQELNLTDPSPATSYSLGDYSMFMEAWISTAGHGSFALPYFVTVMLLKYWYLTYN